MKKETIYNPNDILCLSQYNLSNDDSYAYMHTDDANKDSHISVVSLDSLEDPFILRGDNIK